MYSDVVMEVGKKYFEQLIDEMKEKKGVTQDVDLTAAVSYTHLDVYKRQGQDAVVKDHVPQKQHAPAVRTKATHRNVGLVAGLADLAAKMPKKAQRRSLAASVKKP